MQRTFMLFHDSCQNNTERAITAFSVSQMVVHCVCVCVCVCVRAMRWEGSVAYRGHLLKRMQNLGLIMWK